MFARETTSIGAFHRRYSWLARTGRLGARTVALTGLARRPDDATSAATSARACVRDAEGGREAMKTSREFEGGDVSVVTLCAWAEAESMVKTREGEAKARALRREADGADERDGF